MTTEPALSAELLAGASAYTDTAVIVLSRFSGEGWDRSSIEYNGEYNPWETETSMPKISGEIFPDGDFYLTKEESAMIAQVKQHFSRIAVVLNIGGIIDTSWIKNDDQISSRAHRMAGRHGGRTLPWRNCCVERYPRPASFRTPSPLP